MAHTTTESLDELRKIVRTCPIIDNHAHNLLKPQGLKAEDFLSATSEAEDEALEDHVKALPHFRAQRQLRTLYDVPHDADWSAILKRRRELLETDPNGLIARCLEGTHTILVDDGLYGDFEDYSWHDQFVTTPCKRIVRIEAVAAEILESLHQQGKLPAGVDIADEEACSLAWLDFIAAFEESIAASLEDSEVVGLKSVICYRSGLDIIVGRDADVSEAGLRSFRRHFLPSYVQDKFRVESKGMCDALVISACKLVDAARKATGIAKPIQFHTGLGDNDISLLESDPACMQPLMKHFPSVPIVLLHSSYPFTREAGYLATVHKNVYLDIGLVFPMVSRDGQEKVVRQALEITPTSKILWSTDGHHHPETYYLANLQGRVALEKVLCEYVTREDLTVAQAVQAVKDVLFFNSNLLYNLDLVLPATGGRSVSIHSKSNSRDTARQGSVQYVFVQWLDYNAQMRTRWLPIVEFDKMMTSGPGRFAISNGNLGTTPNDHMSSICDPVGSIYVEPDLSSFRLLQPTGPVKNAATVMARFTDEQGVGLAACPRYTLQRIVHSFEQEYDINFLVGFEIEITFCRRGPKGSDDPFSPLDANHAWGTFSDEQYMTSVALMTSIGTVLQNIGIPIQALHSEAGAGQYEFVLPPLPPVQAVDTLIQAKQCIQQIATQNGLRATCHPMPFPGIGTAAHAHISLNTSTLQLSQLETIEQSFIANILAHLPAITAITMPHPVSYGRVADNSWTGGTWVAWGTNNRETPLRRVSAQRWEIRCLDGLANMYLALGVILGVGLDGVRRSVELKIRDCRMNPTKLSEEEKAGLGIVERLPRGFEDALGALEKDVGEVGRMVGGGEGEGLLVRNWVAVKKAEQEMLNQMGEGERRAWLIERY
ncbi:hypothetical protein M409DRAFT_66787 [Zasmidium cellare ATCC 36951]|uniref:Glutamine synthetase n=1 Tax=Zasmidium cellare ATCC 36951 TaxID=1080233 RepID=A0A6A6CKU6_ZASCE|nr:uncharacterized protein M409DRAFT_66787 [Zasmidium cellare ATCC 36951]KAF2166339.1 hypothetical protein M409DRAFT_66787 [Zasmidium cellare ATCC 36951]